MCKVMVAVGVSLLGCREVEIEDVTGMLVVLTSPLQLCMKCSLWSKDATHSTYFNYKQL